MMSVTTAAGQRGGFALLVVLWVVVGIAALGFTIASASREAIGAARNRIDVTKAAWFAEGCIERARVAINEALTAHRGVSERESMTPWARLDVTVSQSAVLAGTGCDVSMRAAGTALDVNRAGRSSLLGLLGAFGIGAARADSLVDALLDWRDDDDRPRPFGAERDWYHARGRMEPRNRRFGNAREVAMVRGFDELPEVVDALTVDSFRVALSHAPPTVLLSLPGVTSELVGQITERRRRGLHVGDLTEYVDRLSRGAREALMANIDELVPATVPEPEAWIITSKGRIGSPPVVSVVEILIVRSEDGAAIVRRRTWLE